MKLFTATWCNPCTNLKAWLLEQNIEVEIVDIDTETALATKYNIKGIPALLTSEGDIIVTNEVIRPYLLEKKNG